MYNSIFDAENALEQASLDIGSSKVNLIKIIGHIRADQLYKEVEKEDGKKIGSLDEYLKYKNEDFKRITGMGSRQIMRNLRAYAVFCDNLDFPEDWYLAMGEHVLIMGECAHLQRDLTLADHSTVSSYGGRLLGQQELRDETLKLSDVIADDDVQWRVKDTRKLVDTILGKTTPTQAQWFADVYTTLDPENNTLIHINALKWIFDDQVFEFKNDKVWTYKEFHDFVTREKVQVDGSIEGFSL